MSRIPDKNLLDSINKRLMRSGSNCRVTASVQNGYVTLTGNLQYEYQRSAVLKAATGVSGVRQVSDQLKLEIKKKRT